MTEERLIAGRYRLADQIGAGAMGVVWRASDQLLGRTVAVKQLLLGPGLTPGAQQEAKRRAMREGRIAARLHHPNAVTVFDVVEADDQPWLVMEYVDAPSLAVVLMDGRALDPIDVARIGARIAAALAAAHDAGIVHRDVKPGNILVSADGTAKITDFGISRAVGDVTVTATGLMAGTPAYLSPEVARGEEPVPASDVFALGSTLYAAVEGRQLFGDSGNALAVLHTVARAEVEPPRRAGALGPVLMAMLAGEPTSRPTMRQAAEALEAVAAGRPPMPAATRMLPKPEQSPPEPPPLTMQQPPQPPPSAPRKRNRGALIGVAVAAVLIAGGIVAAALAANGSGDDTSTSDQAAPATTVPAPTHSAASAADSPDTQTSAATSSAASGTTTASTTTTTAPAPSSAAASMAAPSFGQVSQFIQSYYADLPGDTQTAWAQLSPDYQAQTGGYGAYSAFWSGIRAVRVDGVSQRGDDTGVATLTYTKSDGSVESEQRWVRVESVNGRPLIADSGV